MGKRLVGYLLTLVPLASLVFLLIFKLGCGVPPSPYSALYVGRTFFLCCNMYYPSTRFHDANYQYTGRFIPLGTPVRVNGMDDQAVNFTDLNTGVTYAWIKRYATVPLASLLKVWFVEEDPKLIVDTFDANVRTAVYTGKVLPGMTKAQVIRALGFPPQHKTPDTSADVWTYWKQTPYTIHFQNGVAVLIGAPQ
jgi:hypothetical protein